MWMGRFKLPTYLWSEREPRLSFYRLPLTRPTNQIPRCRYRNTHLNRLASKSLARLPLGCTVRRSARLALARYRIQIAGLIATLAAFAYARSQFQRFHSDRARVPLLVSTTLDRLATQAALHAQGSASEPWISVGQMRDDVLRDEFSAKRREAIWARVKSVVEMNANVRSSVKEGRLGDVSRVWEWIGSFPHPDRRKSERLSFGGEGTANGKTHPGIEGQDTALRSWDEGRPIY
jgi:hypothetical protein